MSVGGTTGSAGMLGTLTGGGVGSDGGVTGSEGASTLGGGGTEGMGDG